MFLPPHGFHPNPIGYIDHHFLQQGNTQNSAIQIAEATAPSLR